MANFLILFRFTEQGIKNIKESPKRVEQAKELFRKTGVEVKAFYMVLGRYDTAFIAEAPDDNAIAKAVLTLGSLGNVKTETFRLFTEDEFRAIIAAIP